MQGYIIGLENIVTSDKCIVQVYVEEFVRFLKWRCTKKIEDMHRLQKVKDRLWKAQAELDNLETQAKLQLGLSISVKLVISRFFFFRMLRRIRKRSLSDCAEDGCNAAQL